MLSLLCAVFVVLAVPTSGRSQTNSAERKFFESGYPTPIGSDAALFQESPTRVKLDLSGSWKYSLNGSEWNTVRIPSAYDFQGKVTFMRSFEIKPEMLDDYTFSVVVYGINYQSEITINGNFVGRHMGGYTSFVLPIPATTLQIGTENSIKISVDNELTPTTTLPLRQRIGGWRTYGGVFRDLYLLATPRLYVEEAHISYDISKGSRDLKMTVKAEITGRGASVEAGPGEFIGFQVEVYNKLSGELAGRSGITPFPPQVNKSITVSSDLVIANPRLWSPDAPDLYTVRSQIVRVVNREISVLDDYVLDFGFRDARWVDGHLVVNGNPLLLKGVLWVEDHSSFASAMTYEAMERDVATMKTLGVNLIRFPFPPHPAMLSLCDRYGIFVMQDIPLVGVPPEILVRAYYQEMATTYVQEMVMRDRHHVSMLAWGVGDDIEPPTRGVCDYVNGVRNIVKSLDPRPVYIATQSPANPCLDFVDIVAINHQTQDPKEFSAVLSRAKGSFPDKPIIVARYGRTIEPGNQNGYSDPLSTEAQARTAMLFFDVIKDARIAGGVLWAFNDWRTDRPATTSYAEDPFLHAIGIVSHDREKRLAFDFVRARYNGEKVSALPVGTYSPNAPIVYVASGIVALIAFFFTYNGNRRFRDCVNRSIRHTYNFVADIRDQRILNYGHSIFLAVIVSITWATLLSSFFSHYRDSILFDNLLSQVMSDGVKVIFIQLVRNPVEFIAVFSMLILVKLCLLAIVVRLVAFAVRTHVQFYHAFSVTMWSLLPYVLLIPVAMIFYRLSMDTEFYIMPAVVFTLAISLWVVLRLLKGIAIIYDVFPVKVYAFSLLILIIGSAIFYGYLDYTNATSVYLKYIVQAITHST